MRESAKWNIIRKYCFSCQRIAYAVQMVDLIEFLWYFGGFSTASCIRNAVFQRKCRNRHGTHDSVDSRHTGTNTVYMYLCMKYKVQSIYGYIGSCLEFFLNFFVHNSGNGAIGWNNKRPKGFAQKN